MGTLIPESGHGMISLMSEHEAVMQSIRASYRELDAATAPLDVAAERVYGETAQASAVDSHRRARHEMPYYKTNEFLFARRAYENASLSRQFLPQSLVVAMVSQHDAFTAGLIRALHDLKPTLRLRIRGSLSVGELEACDSLEAAGKKLVDDQVSEVLRESHLRQLTWLGDALNMSLSSDQELLDRFQEVIQRRHLYAHTAGIINASYLAARRKVDRSFSGKVGQRLHISAQEFEDAYVTLSEIAVKLWQVTWRKVRSDEVGIAEEALYQLSYNLLAFGDYPLAQRLLRFATEECKCVVDQIRRRNIINLAQSYKWTGDMDRCREALKGDWTSCEDAFALAIAVLNDDFDSAEALMLSVGAAGDIVEQAFSDWPLFREFRRTPQYARAYQRLFGAPDDVRAA